MISGTGQAHCRVTPTAGLRKSNYKYKRRGGNNNNNNNSNATEATPAVQDDGGAGGLATHPTPVSVPPVGAAPVIPSLCSQLEEICIDLAQRWRHMAHMALWPSEADTSGRSDTTAAPSPVGSGQRWHRQPSQRPLLPILMALLMAGLMWSARSVEGGTCWSSALENGKCKEKYSSNITKTDCCASSSEFFYTDHELSEVEFFFSIALGEGTGCMPCVDSCKAIKCGPNKKCVKRQGRPKCICAPECGATHRKRQRQLQQQQQQQQKIFRGHEHHVERLRFPLEKSPRDIRSLSLSSEITNVNLGPALGLRRPGKQPAMETEEAEADSKQQQREENQRNEFAVSSSGLDPAAAGGGRVPKYRRLILATSTGGSGSDEKPTTRRVHHNRSEQARRTSGRKKAHMHRLTITATNTDTNTATNTNNANVKVNAKDRWHGKHGGREGKGQRRKHPPAKSASAFGIMAIASAGGAGAGKVAKPGKPGKPSGGPANSTATSGDRQSLDGGSGADRWPPTQSSQQQQQQQQQPSSTKEYEAPHSPRPVCGSDGRTYNSECQLRKRACRTNQPELRVAYPGHCKTTCSGVRCLHGLSCVEDHESMPHCIACHISCARNDLDIGIGIDSLAPAATRAVCGVDGKTYRSACELRQMTCQLGRSIGQAYAGPCRADRVTCEDIKCGPKLKCLIDLLTHEPKCVSCRYKCSRKHRPKPLRFEDGKLCGVNNRTYNSVCEMRKDSCATGFLIDIKAPGSCHA